MDQSRSPRFLMMDMTSRQLDCTNRMDLVKWDLSINRKTEYKLIINTVSLILLPFKFIKSLLSGVT